MFLLVNGKPMPEKSREVDMPALDPLQWVDQYGDLLMVCKYCARFKKQLVIISQAIRTEDARATDFEESVLSSDARERIKRLLQEQTDSHL